MSRKPSSAAMAFAASQGQSVDQRTNMFFNGIPGGDQRQIVAEWADKHGGTLPPHLAAIKMWPGSQTAGQWLEVHQNGNNGHGKLAT
ncbi:MAG: hypothetical protein M1333_01850 [Patescibacteria group bacterium]|nr:hypothetical protein [Patescibacteria group bacterium]